MRDESLTPLSFINQGSSLIFIVVAVVQLRSVPLYEMNMIWSQGITKKGSEMGIGWVHSYQISDKCLLLMPNEALPQTDEGIRTQINADKHRFFVFYLRKSALICIQNFVSFVKDFQVQGF